MLDLENLMNIRYNSSLPPVNTGNKGPDTEEIVQWLLEVPFFQDFVYRNPPLTEEKEFSDALIIFGDTIIIVSVKSKDGEKDDIEWAKKHLAKAIKQINGAYRALKERRISEFYNSCLNYYKKIDIDVYPYIYGLVILSHGETIYNPISIIDLNSAPKIPLNILSLRDLSLISRRITTAGDLISFLEFRWETLKIEILKINDEANNIEIIINHVRDIFLKKTTYKTSEKKFEQTIQFEIDTLRGDTVNHPDFKYSILVDDMIAWANDIDPSFLTINDLAKENVQKICETLGFLSRIIRIRIGKLLAEYALRAQDGNVHRFVYLQKPIRQLYLFMFTSADRKDRRQYLEAEVSIAQRKYSVERVLGMCSDPVGNKRAYNFIYTDKFFIPEDTIIPKEFLNSFSELEGIGE
jgi:hypothetical protein